MAISDGGADSADLTRPSLGDRLRAGREAKGLSLADVAGQLHLRREQIDALECAQFDYIKGDVFVRGYLKAYARLLGLDADEVVSQYDRLIPEKFRRIPARVGTGANTDSRSLPVTAVVVIVAVVAIVALLVYLRAFSGDVESAPSPEAPAVTAAPSADAARGDASADAGPVRAPASDAAVETGGASVGDPVSTAHAAVVPTVALSSAAAPMVAKVPPNRLTLRFTADCWVEVRDASRKLLVADLEHAGDTLQLTGEPPYRVLLGYVPGVTVTLGGQPVTVTPDAGKQSAKLTIGR